MGSQRKSDTHKAAALKKGVFIKVSGIPGMDGFWRAGKVVKCKPPKTNGAPR